MISGESTVNFLEILTGLLLLLLALLGINTLRLYSLQTINTTTTVHHAHQLLHNANLLINAVTDPILFEQYYADWQHEVAQSLPQGRGEIKDEINGKTSVVCWGGASPASCPRDKTGVQGCLYQQSIGYHPD